MPVIGISVKHLNRLLGKSLSPESLSNALEQLGCDLEGIAEVTLYECSCCKVPMERLTHEDAPKKCTLCGYEAQKAFAKVSQDQVIRLDLLPARPDFFDPGGLSRALKGYLDIETGLPEYETATPQIAVNIANNLQNAESYRPFIACAVVTMPTIDTSLLRDLMKLQENLHWGIGRDRKLASIGIYDLDTITPPISYRTVQPQELEFHPLGYPDILMTPQQVLTKHPKGVAYAHLVEKLRAYPLLIDSRQQVLSMPPIINSDETKVKIGSKRLFIDVTGITHSDVTKALNTLVSSLMEMHGKVESVKLTTADATITTPQLASKSIEIHLESAKKWLGLNLKARDLCKYLEKMRFSVKGKSPAYTVYYPAFRTDIKHEVDVFEDIAIAYGYHQIPLQMVSTMTLGEERNEEKLSQLVRQVMLGMGFTEIFSLMLTSHHSHFEQLRLEAIAGQYVVLQNPKIVENNVMRCHLLSGLMECMAKNRRKVVPQTFFELGNVVLVNPDGVSTREERRLGFAQIGPDVGYADIRSVVDTVLRELGWKGSYESLHSRCFVEGRAANIKTDNGLSARIGEVHPQVLKNFGLSYPATLGELTLAHVI